MWLRRRLKLGGRGKRLNSESDPVNVLDSVTESLREDAESQYLARFLEYGAKARRGVDPSTLSKEALQRFRSSWDTLDGRLRIVPGKKVLRRVNTALQEAGESAVHNATAGQTYARDRTSHVRLLPSCVNLTD